MQNNFGEAVIYHLYSYQNMAILKCRDYGFDCDFIAQGNDVGKVIDEYGAHSADEHGIEYSKEALMQFIIRKG